MSFMETIEIAKENIDKILDKIFTEDKTLLSKLAK